MKNLLLTIILIVLTWLFKFKDVGNQEKPKRIGIGGQCERQKNRCGKQQQRSQDENTATETVVKYVPKLIRKEVCPVKCKTPRTESHKQLKSMETASLDRSSGIFEIFKETQMTIDK
jgi:hypothetical protein